MPKMSKSNKILWGFFWNPATGRRNYNAVCVRCCHGCKQSYRAVLIECPRYTSGAAKGRRTGSATRKKRR